LKQPVTLATGIFAPAFAVCAQSARDFVREQLDERRASDGEIGERIVEFVEHSESAGFSGAVLAARNGQLVAAVGVASADLDGKSPNTAATLFKIASATKQFTAAAYAVGPARSSEVARPPAGRRSQVRRIPACMPKRQ
jgi:CubicO group peptidase (beta-lactamase class C family)